MRTILIISLFVFLVSSIESFAQPIYINKIFDGSNLLMASIPFLPIGNAANYYNSYNVTQNITNNITNNVINNYTMNETEPNFNGNFSQFNPFYNQTTPAINWVIAQNYYLASNPFNFINSTYNSTYNNFIVANVSNQSQYCYYVNNATERNLFTSGGSGISFTQFNYTKVDVTSTRNLSTQYNDTQSLMLSANKNITIECELLAWSQAATTGLQYLINITGSTSMVITMRYFTSVTAIALCQGATDVTCVGASSAGTVISPTEIYAYAQMGGVGGRFMVQSKSELNNSYVNVTRGSWCRSIES